MSEVDQLTRQIQAEPGGEALLARLLPVALGLIRDEVHAVELLRLRGTVRIRPTYQEDVPLKRAR